MFLQCIKIFVFNTHVLIDQFTVVDLVTWPLNGSEAGVDLVLIKTSLLGGAVASWLVRSTPERAVRVRALAGDSALCSWARHFTLTVPLSTQVYKWVPAICWGNLTKLQGSDLRWTSIPSRGSRNTSSRLMLQKPG